MKQLASGATAYCLLVRQLMKNARLLVSLCATAALASLAACSTSTSTGPDSTITVENHSQSRIQDLRIAPPGQTDFGANLLTGGDLLPGDSVTFDVFCDNYDVQLTDDTGTTCLVPDVNVCANDAIVIITEADLNSCAGFFRNGKPHAFTVNTSTSSK